MEDIFITDIEIKKVRHLKDLKIHISDKGRKHLILTGKNGSGKTSVLETIKENFSLTKDFFCQLNNNELFENKLLKNDFLPENIKNEQIKLLSNNKSIKTNIVRKNLIDFKNKILDIKFKKNQYEKKLYIFFPAKHPLENMQIPKGVEKLELKENTNLNEKLNIHFLQYIVNKINDKAQYFMKNDFNKANEIQKWFDNFEGLLKKIFNDATLKLDYDVENKNFYILQKNREPFDFNSFSDGYKSILAIVSEIIMQSDFNKKSYEEIQGIVLIDEVETHLHLELQKQILPFLTTLFPKIQFIVTTHSPFVLNSIENAVVYDLEYGKIFNSVNVDNYIENIEDKEKTISNLNGFLGHLNPLRDNLNSVKKNKDKLVVEYIVSCKPPKEMDFKLLNYKALLFYFKQKYVKSPIILEFDRFNNKIKNQDKFKSYFNDGKIHINSRDENFLHLIGVRKSEHNNTIVKEFLEDIYYDTKLIKDWEEHRIKQDKMITFSWIFQTLITPSFIITRDSIKQKENIKYNADLTFIKRVFNDNFEYHLVGIEKEKSSNIYYIKSHFPIKNIVDLKYSFDLKKKIFEYKKMPR